MSTTWKQVVLDVADAWREANDSTAKIPVGQLPNKVKEGGENIDPELTTLEGTLQEILEILPFKGAMASGQYVWEKLDAENGNFIEYVASNDESKYPDGGWKDGYWYEKIIDFQTVGVTKVAIDKFTLSTTTKSSEYTIQHSLGAVPKYVLVLIKDIPSSNPTGYAWLLEMVVMSSAPKLIFYTYKGSNSTTISNNKYEGATLTASTIKLALAYYFPAGYEYNVITMA